MSEALTIALRAIDPAALDYDKWLRVGMGLHSEGLPVSVWDDWSRSDSRYKPGECERKWRGFSGNGVTGATIMSLAKEAGWKPSEGHVIPWDPPAELTPAEQLQRFLRSLFEDDEIIGYCIESMWDSKRGKYTPLPGVFNRTAGEILEALKSGDLEAAIGSYNHAAGAWIRLNPLDGSGQKKANVTAWRYVLVESDDMPIGKQREELERLKLPIATLVSSGGKSLHAAVHIDASSLDEYEERVRFLFDYLQDNGFAVDQANKDPCRLSRLPGAERGEEIQELLGTCLGFSSWAEWYESVTGPTIICASDVPYEPPQWAIAPYFPRGKLTLIQAESGVGKTAFMCAVAAHITTGSPLLDCPIVTPGNVLMLSVEDDESVLRGRVTASGGNVDKLFFLKDASSFSFDSPEIERAAKRLNARMIIFDPFQMFLGSKVDMHRANETRPKLAHLAEMAKRLDLAIVIIAHTGKASADKSSVYKSLGSVDIPAAMRSILHIVNDPEDKRAKIVCHVKSSNSEAGQAIRYIIGERGGVTFDGYTEEPDLTAIVSRRKREELGVTYEKEPLVQVFNQLITDRPGGGFWSYEEVKRTGAKILGFPPYSTAQDLKSKLESGLARELQARDGLIVTYGAKQSGVRGVRVEQYSVPQGYQTKLAPG